MNNCKNSLLFAFIILIILCIYYNKDINEGFEDVPQCYNPQFNVQGEGNDMEYCAEIEGVGNGCQKFDVTSGRDNRLAAFSIFGSYIDHLDPNSINNCMEPQGKTLSEWGLCDKELLKQIRGFGHNDNSPRLNASEHACEYYEKGFKNNQAKIQE